QRSQYCWALRSHGSSTRETAWQSCALGLTAVAFIATSTARNSLQQGRGHSASAFYYADFVHATASNIHPPVGRCRHIAHHASPRRNGGARESIGPRIGLNERVGRDSRSAVRDLCVRGDGDAVG